jgi:hypothetical protein
VVIEVVNGLKSAGVRPQDIILFERYAREFREAAYTWLMDQPLLAGVRWYAASAQYTDDQLAIDGLDGGAERDPHVVGYDPDVFVSMGFCQPSHSPRDDRRFRSHLSVIATRMVNKLITIPCLKDHRSAGVTLALKNLSHGLNNNVARSHIAPSLPRLDGAATTPNQCNTFIPTAVAQEPIRRKATLHVLDGLVGVYEGGPGPWNATWSPWRRQSLFFATDPVAMDMVGWEIIDAKRAEEGWVPVAHAGLVQAAPAVTLSPRLAALATLGVPEAAALAAAEHHRRHPRPPREQFDIRQPEHVLLAGLLGLGEWDGRRIDHRTIRV